ncbi:MAG TPA: DnaB-like helicase N-terminal domain-containing protein [Polyangiaceae bacterium]|nr:DnaB-like helicase N-terminal domain-containing protein [Polyangiaceae bacterium]
MTLPREDVKPVGPHDGDSEQVVLSALLCGHATIEDVKPLEARHFYSTFNARLFGVLCTSAERELPALIDLLDMRGPVLEELTLIRDASPFVCVPLLSVEVAKILDRWLERELIRVMQELDAQLRVGAITHDGARARLRQHFMENAG